MMPQPAHTLTIMYPVMLVNLLPCDLSYQVKNTPAKGNIKAGKSVPLYTVSSMSRNMLFSQWHKLLGIKFQVLPVGVEPMTFRTSVGRCITELQETWELRPYIITRIKCDKLFPGLVLSICEILCGKKS